MLAVKEGDRAAFGVLVGRHIQPLYNYAYRLSRNPSNAEDLVQDTFLNAWQKSGSYKIGKVQLTTWLHRILYNKFIDETRKQKDVVAGDKFDLIEDPVSPEASHVAKQAKLHLDKLLRRLPENQRAAIMLAHVQGFSNTQTAEILNTSVHAVESLLSRARRTLRHEFSDGETTQNEH
jgi:RNA polymerase sigma-70 factor (ECF subfamily)